MRNIKKTPKGLSAVILDVLLYSKFEACDYSCGGGASGGGIKLTMSLNLWDTIILSHMFT